MRSSQSDASDYFALKEQNTCLVFCVCFLSVCFAKQQNFAKVNNIWLHPT
jgi:hypothetical protein